MNEWVKTGNIKGPSGGSFPDAPSDGETYARKNAAWTPAATPDDVVAEADARIAADLAETTARQNADADLQGQILADVAALGVEVTNRTNADAGLQTQINLKAPLDSPALTGNPTAPTPAAADNDTSVATTAFVQGEIAGKVSKTGDTMTGTLVIAPPSGNPILSMTKAAAGAAAYIQTRTGALLRWVLWLNDAGAESGSNAGSDFAIDRYDDAGVKLGRPFEIKRSTGIVEMPLGATTATPPVGDSDTSVATTAFVQAATLRAEYAVKATVVDADYIAGWDSAASYGKARWLWSTFKDAITSLTLLKTGANTVAAGAGYLQANYVTDAPTGGQYRPSPLGAGVGTAGTTPGNFRLLNITGLGAWTFNAPTDGAGNGCCSMVVIVLNGASPGAVTFAGFNKITGTFATAANAWTLCYITKFGSIVTLFLEPSA